MRNFYYTYQPPQTWRPLQASGTSLPQRLKVQLPLKGAFSSSVCHETRPSQPTSSLATTPTSSPPPVRDPQGTQTYVSKGYEPTQYILDDGPRGETGTSAYYKSWAFRQKVNKCIAVVAEQEDGEEFNDSSDEEYIQKRNPVYRRASLIMVFSRTNVRRSSTQRKVNMRIQSFNRRM